MARKAKTLTLRSKKQGKRERAKKPYSSLAKRPSPAERLASLLQNAAARGVRPMNEEELDQFIDAHRDAWPDDGEIDEFIAWLQQARREGRYR